MHIEVAKKVRDTMAVLASAYRDRDEDLGPICSHLFGGLYREVEVILFLEEDESRAQTVRGYRDRPNVEQSIKALLKPYGFRCHVQRRRTLPEASPWSVTALRADAAGTVNA